MYTYFNFFTQWIITMISYLQRDKSERTKQMEQILNFQVPAEALELVILLHTQY